MERHITDRVDFSNFGVPSWRIEQRFNTGVLIGNWAEERQKFSNEAVQSLVCKMYNIGDTTQPWGQPLETNTYTLNLCTVRSAIAGGPKFPTDKYKHNTTNRLDFRNFKGAHPDVNVRRKAKLGSEGIPADMLFRHHGQNYDDMCISLYDENYNGRWREKNMPALRDWDSQSLRWLPERTDHPLKGAPTNFGLKERQEAIRAEGFKDMYYPELASTYQTSYIEKPADAMKFARYATPKHLSTNLLPCNKVNNNLHLRGKPTLRLPEIMPQELTTPSV